MGGLEHRRPSGDIWAFGDCTGDRPGLSCAGDPMATKTPKRGSRNSRKQHPAKRTAKRKARGNVLRAKGTARPLANALKSNTNPAKTGSSSSSAGPPDPNQTGKNHARKAIPAWNEVEIDEQRENAGRPEPAFLTTGNYTEDDLAEELGEEFVMTATSGEQAAEDLRNQDVPEERGGPFIETSGRTEFGYGPDPSNPEDAEPAAFPTVITSLEEEEALAQGEAEAEEERTS